MKTQDLTHYMNLPYTLHIEAVHDENGDRFKGTVLEFDGCVTFGATYEQTYEKLRVEEEKWLAARLHKGEGVPEPVRKDLGEGVFVLTPSQPEDPMPMEEFSGKFVIRIPKSLHKRLSLEAQQDGVSLNQYVLYKLSQ